MKDPAENNKEKPQCVHAKRSREYKPNALVENGTILSEVGPFKSFHKVAHCSQLFRAGQRPKQYTFKSLLIIWFYICIERGFNRRVLKRKMQKDI